MHFSRSYNIIVLYYISKYNTFEWVVAIFMSNQRRTKIKDYIDNRGEATIAELLNLCGGCSNMTLWRDLK